MTRLKSQMTGQAPANFGILFSTAAALTSPVQGMLDRPFYGDVPALTERTGTWFGRALDMLLLWHERVRQRRQLAELNEIHAARHRHQPRGRHGRSPEALLARLSRRQAEESPDEQPPRARVPPGALA